MGLVRKVDTPGVSCVTKFGRRVGWKLVVTTRLVHQWYVSCVAQVNHQPTRVAKSAASIDLAGFWKSLSCLCEAGDSRIWRRVGSPLPTGDEEQQPLWRLE
jgi:hypothetical protein